MLSCVVLYAHWWSVLVVLPPLYLFGFDFCLYFGKLVRTKTKAKIKTVKWGHTKCMLLRLCNVFDHKRMFLVD